MYLIAIDPPAIGRQHPRAPRRLLAGERGVNIEQPETLRVSSLEMVGIPDAPAQYLKAPTDAEHRGASLGERVDSCAQPGAAQMFQAGHRVLATGKKDGAHSLERFWSLDRSWARGQGAARAMASRSGLGRSGPSPRPGSA